MIFMLFWLIPVAPPAMADPATRPGADTTPPIRLVTWNLQGCTGGIEAVLKVLRGLDGDVICLQEAEAGTPQAPGINQAVWLADQLRMQVFSAGSMLPSGREQRVAILYDGELTDTQILDAGTGRRYGVTAVIGWRNQRIRVVSVHLTASYRLDVRHALRTTRARMTEAVDLLARTRKWAEPFIIAGDFNAVPEMPEHQLLGKHLYHPPTTQPTYPSHRPRLTIDHVYHSDGLAAPPTRVVIAQASDHRPVVAVLEFERTPATSSAPVSAAEP